MTFFAIIKAFQYLYCKHFTKLTQVFGREFGHWFYIIQKVLIKVAKKLSRPDSKKVRKCFAKCLIMLLRYKWEQKNWDVRSFVLILQQIDPRLSMMLFQILYGVVNHPKFSGFVQRVRKERRCEEESCEEVSDGIYIYRTFRVYDAFVRMVNYWLIHWLPIPVPQPICSIPFLRDRLPLCGVDNQMALITHQKRLQMVCISAHFRFAISKIFSNQGITQPIPISKDMKQVLRKYFSLLF